jgi:LPS export ABC transporter protein LptC
MRRILFIFLFLAIPGIFFLIRKTGNETEGIRPAIGSYMEDVRVVNTKGGRHVWSIFSRRADIAEGQSAIRLSGVSVILPDDGLTLNADSGIYDTESNGLSLKENIRAAIKGYVVKAESLKVNPGDGGLRAEGEVTIEGKGIKIKGIGIDASGRENIKLLKDVRAVFF